MSGIFLLSMGGAATVQLLGTYSMTAGATSVFVDPDYVDYYGYADADAGSYAGTGAFGSMTKPPSNAGLVRGLYYNSYNLIYLDVTGNISSGAFSTVTVNGTSIGAVASRTFVTTHTVFLFNGSGSSPFAYGSTYSIVIS